MIISRTPLRVSFLGGGSDLASFYRQSHGAVLSTAINKYIYITVNKKFDQKVRASYSITEMVDQVADLKHELIREALRVVGIDGGIEVTSISDIPSQGTGLGSSSTYTVGLLNALYAYKGVLVGAERLAREACEIEINRCGKPIGKQDQYIAAYGGMQYIQFNPDESVYVDPLIIQPALKKTLQRRFMMFYTGITRSADAILTEQKANTESREEPMASLNRMVKMAGELRMALMAGNPDSFGELLHQGWLEKKKLAGGISNATIDCWYDQARRAGAIGGKILGAGGGGFLLLYVPEEKQAEVRAALAHLRLINFGFEPQGSKIIYVEDEIE